MRCRPPLRPSLPVSTPRRPSPPFAALTLSLSLTPSVTCPHPPLLAPQPPPLSLSDTLLFRTNTLTGFSGLIIADLKTKGEARAVYQRVLDIAPLAANWKGLEGGSAMTNSLSELDTAHPTGCTTGIPSRAIPCMTYYGSLNCNVRDPAQCDAVRAEFMDTVRAGDAATLALEDDATGTEVFHPTFEMTTNGGFHLVFNGDVIVQQCDSSVPVPTAGVLSAAQATTELVRQATAGTLSVQEDTTTSGGFPMRRTVVMGVRVVDEAGRCVAQLPYGTWTKYTAWREVVLRFAAVAPSATPSVAVRSVLLRGGVVVAPTVAHEAIMDVVASDAAVAASSSSSSSSSSSLLPCWTYADDSESCLQTYVNYAAMWVTMKGTGIDTGHPSSKIVYSRSTCADRGYSVKTDLFKDLPGVVRAAYAGVTTWSKEPQSTTIMLS